MPDTVPGSVVVRVLASPVLFYQRDIYDGTRGSLLDEDRLCVEVDEGRLGYSPWDLVYLWQLTVPFGGLRSIDLKPGGTVVVCPSTGGFGGAGVHVAAALGARVIAMGRNEEELARLKTFVRKGIPSARVDILKITGDKEAACIKAFGIVNAVAVAALRRGGRISIMGSVGQNIIDWNFLSNDLSAKAKLMYDREDLFLFVKMLEAGLFSQGADLVETKYFALEDWQEDFEEATIYADIGRIVALTP